MAVVIITGTSTGIGFATAVALGRAGHEVFATMRHPERSPALQTVATQEHLPITVLPLDVTQDDSVAHAVQQILAARGRLDVLVNNAGIAPLGAVEDLPLSAFRQTMDTNCLGALCCIQAALPHMRAQHSGCIINVSSVAGRIASAGQSAYCASKFALEALSEALAAEVKAYNIRVVLVEPGIIDTPILEKVGALAADSLYPQARRLNALFAAALQVPVAPAVVGEQIREIVASDSWRLRYPVGPDAAGFLGWRASLSDEDFVDFGALDEEAWCEFVRANFGLDIQPHLGLGSPTAG